MGLDSASIARSARPLLVTLLVGVFLGMSSQAAAAIYRWVDAGGREHFTMDLEQVPPQYRSAAAAAEKRSRSRMNIVGGESSQGEAEAATPSRSSPRKLDAAKPGGHDEAWWRAQHRRHLNDVENARDAAARANDISNYPAYYRGSSQHERRHARNAAKRARGAAVKQAEERVRAAEKKLADFLEGARRAGVPPGWLR